MPATRRPRSTPFPSRCEMRRMLMSAATAAVLALAMAIPASAHEATCYDEIGSNVQAEHVLAVGERSRSGTSPERNTTTMGTSVGP